MRRDDARPGHGAPSTTWCKVTYAATRALALGRQAETSPRLTPPEVEVLMLLADGLCYQKTPSAAI